MSRLSEAVQERLTAAIPEPRCELNHGDAYTLLIATILSAQSTDRTVNTVTPDLFTRWPEAADLADAPIEEVEAVIKRTGFFRNKAKAITGTARMLRDDFGGEVPQTMAELIKLPGVARKTANVVLGTAFHIPSGMAVDTHAGRLSRRLGITDEKKAAKVEKALCAVFPKADWPQMQHRMVLHGRYVCTSRKPKCADCVLNEVCPQPDAEPVSDWPVRAAQQADHLAEVWSGPEFN